MGGTMLVVEVMSTDYRLFNSWIFTKLLENLLLINRNAVAPQIIYCRLNFLRSVSVIWLLSAPVIAPNNAINKRDNWRGLTMRELCNGVVLCGHIDRSKY